MPIEGRLSIRHGAWIEIDPAALKHNVGVLRRVVPSGVQLGVLVKADGYGHGLELAALAAIAGGADRLMVATLDEGLALRGAGVRVQVAVLYPIAIEGLGDAVTADLELTASGLRTTRRLLEAWRKVAPLIGAPIRLHVEVDTGLGRGGVEPDRVAEVFGLIEAAPGASITGIWSHLADGTDPIGTARQVRRFEGAVATLAATGRTIPVRHLAATAGVFAGTAPVYDVARIGLAYYGDVGSTPKGTMPGPFAAFAKQLRPAMTVKARAVRIEDAPVGSTVGYGSEWTAQRPSLLATLPIGYADGWTRAYWPGATAIVRGRRVALVGRVSMDSVCADVTDAGDVTFDDEFVLLGRQGSERITPGELASLRGTVPYEILTSFGSRLPRIVVVEPADH